jgi:uncharacterized protein (DUF58 family)
MLTGRGLALLIGGALLWGVGRLLGVAELYVVAVAAAALVGVGAIAVRLSSARVSVRRGLSEARLLHGRTADVAIDLRNDSRLPAPLLLVEDDVDWMLAPQPRFMVAGLRPGTTQSLRYEIRGGARGRYAIGPLRLRVRDPFGATQLVRRYSSRDEVLVYPRVERLPDGLARGSHRGSGSSDARRLLNAGDEFHTMREYVQGDDLRQVHWPSTAKRQKLMVRQQEMPFTAEAVVFCDTRLGASHGAGPDAAVEVAISAAASTVWHLADHGYRLRLHTEADGGRPVEGWDAILDALAEIQPSRVASVGGALTRLRGAGGEGLLVCVVMVPPGDEPLASHPDVRAMIHAGRGHGGRVGIVVHPPHHDRRRAGELVRLLRAARWRAVTLPTDVPLAERWRELLGPRPHLPPSDEQAAAAGPATVGGEVR